MIASNDEEGTTTLHALIPSDDGRMRVDPVPLPPRSDRNAFAYGYGGGTPVTTYQALLRCALGDGADIHRTIRTTGETASTPTPAARSGRASPPKRAQYTCPGPSSGPGADRKRAGGTDAD